MDFFKILLLLPIWIISFNLKEETPKNTTPWSEWNKYKDCPGLEYRTSCMGQAFEGSKFYKLQIEIINSYNTPVTAEIMIVDDFNMNVSEIHNVKLTPGFNKKLHFNHVKIPCLENYDFKIFASLN
jgi:hypothetical protein